MAENRRVLHAQALGSIDGQLDVSGNTALPGLPGSFVALRTVTGDLFLNSNGFLTLDGSFPVRPPAHFIRKSGVRNSTKR